MTDAEDEKSFEWSAHVGYKVDDIDVVLSRIEADGIPDGVATIATDASTRRVTLAVDVTTGGPAVTGAVTAAVKATFHAARALGLGQPVAIQVEPWADGPGRVSLAPLGMLSMGEVAEKLGVSRQRAHQLADSDPAFPAPMGTTPAGGIWEQAAVEAYAAARQPKAGRPRKQS